MVALDLAQNMVVSPPVRVYMILDMEDLTLHMEDLTLDMEDLTLDMGLDTELILDMVVSRVVKSLPLDNSREDIKYLLLYYC